MAVSVISQDKRLGGREKKDLEDFAEIKTNTD